MAAGVPIEASEDVIGEEMITQKMAESGEYFGLRISGNSMEPEIHHGSIVIVRQQDDVENGDIAIVLINGGEATCKKIEKFEPERPTKSKILSPLSDLFLYKQLLFL